MPRITLVLLLALSLTASAQKKKDEPPPPPNIDVSKYEPGLYTIINTQFGAIAAQLFDQDVPNTVANFTGLATGRKPWVDPKTKKVVARPMFNDITFHRVIPLFMIQTGDPTATGRHDCGFFIKDEIVPKFKFDRAGRLAMANSGAPNSGACQWFITEASYPSGDGKYTIFGQVMEGLDVVKKISHVLVDENDKPRVPIKLYTVTVLRVAAKADPPAN